MKYIVLVSFSVLLFLGCKKESQPDDNDYLETARRSLKDSLPASDFTALDFAKAVRSRVDSIDLYTLSVPFKNKVPTEDFVFVKTDEQGRVEQGKIVHLAGRVTEEATGGVKRKRWDGAISLSSLDRKNVLQSPIVDGYILAYHNSKAYRTSVQEAPVGVLPEVIIVYTLTSGGLSWSDKYLLQSMYANGGGGGGNNGGYYGSGGGSSASNGGGGSGSSNSGGGGGNMPGGGTPTSPVIHVDVEKQDENPAIDIQKFLNCFNAIPDAGATCSIEIMTDIPVDSNPNAVYDIDARSPGHTFLSISKSNGSQHVTQNIGFYPRSGYKSITYAPVASKIVDNGGHEFNASLRMPLTPERLKIVLQALLLYKERNYDVDEYNCTDFALDVLNSVRGIGLSIPLYGIPGSPLTQATRTPGGLYNKLQQMVNNKDPEKGNITIGFYKAYAGGSHGPCN